MFIGGFQKISLVDYPGVICSTIFTKGCNFRCGYCHNPDLVLGKVENLKIDEILSYLEESKGKKIDGVCICGGEPTIHRDLPDFISKIKEMGLKVKLDTNGSNPDILKKCQVDYVAMDVKTSLSRYHEICWIKNIQEKIKESIDYLINQKKIEYEFRTTLVPELVGVDELAELSTVLKNSKKWFWQNFSNKKTLDPNFEKISPYSLEILNQLKENLKQINSEIYIR
jgi:pyruvate formate lyase activating enzyme